MSSLANLESEDLTYSRREMDVTEIYTGKIVDRERENGTVLHHVNHVTTGGCWGSRPFVKV